MMVLLMNYIQVSSSCTSVYLDGSEVRGSQNATIVATFSHFTGSASFTVWMPEVPLLVDIQDTKLSQIKGWKAPKPTPLHHHPMKSNNTMRNSASCGILYEQAVVQV